MSQRSATLDTPTRSPVPAILAALGVGVVVTVAMLLGPASDGSEATVTGSVLVAFAVTWGLIALLSTRFSSQPQRWAAVPAIGLGGVGLALLVIQPTPAVMDVLGWIWPIALAVLLVWVVAQLRGQLHGRGRWLVIPVIVILAGFTVGGALTNVGSVTASAADAADGTLIDVGGRRLYLECTGSGRPVVVLQAGLGGSSAAWDRIAPSVEASTTVCRYDRAGHGRSDEAAEPQDGIALATDLHTLLERAGIPGPYVLVGHSSGGVYVRVFAARYPDEVAGMVLLDAQPADAFAALPDYPAFYANMRRVATLSPSLARVGLLGPILGLPADESTVGIARGGRDEILALPDAMDQARTLTTIGDHPLVVVTAGADQQAGWLEAQDGLVALSATSIHRVMPAATHTSLISGEDAAGSTQAILDVVASIRTGTAVR